MTLDTARKYTLRKGLQLKDDGEGLLVLDTESTSDSYMVHELNESAASVARLCDGQTSCEQMVLSIVDEHGANPHEAAEVVYKGLQLLQDQKLLEAA